MNHDDDTTGAVGPELVSLQVEGMSCSGCEARIGKALRRVEGVREAWADHTTGKVRVRVWPGVEPERLAAKITAAGYMVTGGVPGPDAGAAGEL